MSWTSWSAVDAVPAPADGLPAEATGWSRRRRAWGQAALGALGIAWLAAVAGIPAGLVWAVVAPAQPLVKVAGGLAPRDPAPEQFAAADGWFTIVGFAAGVLVAVAAWWLARRRRGPLILLALVAGGIAGGVLAWWIGHRIGLTDYRAALAAAQPGTRLDRPPDLRVMRFDWWPPRVAGVLLVEALGAALTYTMLAGWSRHANLRDTPVPAAAVPEPMPGPVSWGSAGPPDPLAAQVRPAPDAGAPPPG